MNTPRFVPRSRVAPVSHRTKWYVWDRELSKGFGSYATKRGAEKACDRQNARHRSKTVKYVGEAAPIRQYKD